MQVGDLVKVTAKELRIPIGSIGVVTRLHALEDSRGTTIQYWVRTTESREEYWFRHEWLEVISERLVEKRLDKTLSV